MRVSQPITPRWMADHTRNDAVMPAIVVSKIPLVGIREHSGIKVDVACLIVFLNWHLSVIRGVCFQTIPQFPSLKRFELMPFPQTIYAIAKASPWDSSATRYELHHRPMPTAKCDIIGAAGNLHGRRHGPTRQRLRTTRVGDGRSKSLLSILKHTICDGIDDD